VTFTDVQNIVADRLNLTSAKALARIGTSINERYAWLVSSVGLITSARTQVTANTTIGSQFVTFAAEKLFSVYNPAYTPPIVLDIVSVDELRNEFVSTDPPTQYAIYNMGASTVTIQINTAAGSVYPLGADAEANLITLSGLMVPNFPADFHNILVYGAMATELDHLEKYDMAKVQEARFTTRLGELRLFIAKSAYLNIYQGKSQSTNVLSDQQA
jgi:hypothetical protein